MLDKVNYVIFTLIMFDDFVGLFNMCDFRTLIT